jgi:hypothetical protein
MSTAAAMPLFTPAAAGPRRISFLADEAGNTIGAEVQ